MERNRIVMPPEVRQRIARSGEAVARMRAPVAVVVSAPNNAEIARLKGELEKVARERDALLGEIRARAAREARLPDLLRPVPQVVVTSRAVHVRSTFDAEIAVPLKLPLFQRVKRWFLRA